MTRFCCLSSLKRKDEQQHSERRLLSDMQQRNWEGGRYHGSMSKLRILLPNKQGRCNLGARTLSCHWWASKRPGCPRVYLRMGRGSLQTRSPHWAQTPGWWGNKLRFNESRWSESFLKPIFRFNKSSWSYSLRDSWLVGKIKTSWSETHSWHSVSLSWDWQ